MERNRLTYREGKDISITGYLSKIGINPAYVRGNDWWYTSPFHSERTPSFKVNDKLNLWFDHSIGEGGTLLDLGAKLHRCTVSEFLDTLSQGGYAKFPVPHQPKENEPAVSKVEIISVKNLVDNSLLHYLKFRGIDPDTARLYCNEVDFRIRTRDYKAIGFPNRSGGYELRNSWFKGASSPKDISLIVGDPNTIAVLEGFMNFLSLIQVNLNEGNSPPPTGLVLNSVNLLTRSLPILLEPQREVVLYLDNDAAGRKAKDELLSEGIVFKDGSTIYKNHKDLNEWLMQMMKANGDQRAKTSRRFKI
jgi:hypothetical protein